MSAAIHDEVGADMPKRIHAEIPIRADAEQIYLAWTESDALQRWFAEDADVDVDEGRYAFWGRYQPDAPQQDAADQRVLLADSGQRLRFDWRVGGVETTVDVRIEQHARATRVTVDQEWLPDPAAAVIEAFWSLSLENLRGWLERGVVGARCDFSQAAGEVVHLSIDVDAQPDAVFQALVDPRQIDRYMGSNASIEPVVGGAFSLGWSDHKPMRILDLEPNKRLSYTWDYEGDEHARDTVVTWSLEGSGGKTRLTLVHSGFSAKRGSEDYKIGWLDFLNRIKFMVEVGPSWSRPNTHGMHRSDEPVDAALYSAVLPD